jgi:hypothetical protein
VETIRFRFMANAYLASGCMFTMGVVFAPLLRYWRWMVWPSLVLLLIAGLFGWRAYRLWGQWLTELEARDRASEPSKTYPQCTADEPPCGECLEGHA